MAHFKNLFSLCKQNLSQCLFEQLSFLCVFKISSKFVCDTVGFWLAGVVKFSNRQLVEKGLKLISSSNSRGMTLNISCFQRSV